MPKTYETVQGDMWDIISLKCYGNEKYMHILMDANSNFNKIVVFPANIKLTVPEISRKETVTFPSWRSNA